MRYLIIFLFLCSNAIAEDFSIECKLGSVKSDWGDRYNDIWFIREKDRDVCSFDKNRKHANCWAYINEKFQDEEITFYPKFTNEKFVLNRVSARMLYYYKDTSFLIKRWKYHHHYNCRKINFIPQKFYTYNEYRAEEAIKKYERNRKKF